MASVLAARSTIIGALAFLLVKQARRDAAHANVRLNTALSRQDGSVLGGTCALPPFSCWAGCDSSRWRHATVWASWWIGGSFLTVWER